ncbi:MAG: DUF6449 domain-containing protein [Blautia sp.]
MKSRIFSSKMVNENLKKQIWIPVLAMIGFLILQPVILMVRFDQWKAQKLPYEAVEKYYEKFLGLDAIGMVLFAAVAGMAVLCAVAGFEYLHSRKKMDLYHSLPVKRDQLYWQHVWTGFLCFVVPYFIGVFLSICVGATHGYFNFHFVQVGMTNLVSQSLLFLLVYAVSSLAMMLTGRVLVGILGSAVLLLYVPGVIQLLRGYESAFFRTYSGMPSEPGTVYYFFDHYGSPLSWCVELLNRYRQGESLVMLWLAALAVVVLLLLLNSWVYRKRPTEAVGRSMAFPKVSKGIQYLLEIPVTLLVGIFAYGMVSTHQKIWWVIGLAAGIVIIHGVIEVIYHADFRKFFGGLTRLGISAVIVAAICVVFQMDLVGYDSYLPAKSKLESIGVSGSSITGSYSVYMTDNQGELLFKSEDEGCGYLKMGADSEFYSLLKDTVGREEEENGLSTTIQVRYELDGGKNVYRSYSVSLEELRKASQEIPKMEELKTVLYPQLEEKSKYVHDITYENGVSYSIYNSSGNYNVKGSELLKLLAQDVSEADADVFKEEPIGVLNLSYSGDQYMTFYGSGCGNEVLLVYPGFQRVVQYLEEQGITPKDELKSSDIEKVTIHKWTDDYGDEEQITYDKPEEIKKIFPYLRLSGTWTSWEEERDGDVSVEVQTKDKTQSDQGFRYGYCLAKGWNSEK